MKKPEAWIPESSTFLLHEIDQTPIPDFCAVAYCKNDFRVWRGVEELFPIHVPREILICLKAVLVILVDDLFDRAFSVYVLVPDFGQKLSRFNVICDFETKSSKNFIEFFYRRA